MRSIWTIKTNIINVNIVTVQIILCKRVQAIPGSGSYRQLKTKIFFTPWGIWFCSTYRRKNTKNKNLETNSNLKYPYKINKKEISSFCEEEGEKLGKWIVEFSKGKRI